MKRNAMYATRTAGQRYTLNQIAASRQNYLTN